MFSSADGSSEESADGARWATCQASSSRRRCSMAASDGMEARRLLLAGAMLRH